MKFYMDPGGAEVVYLIDHWKDVAFDIGKPVEVELCEREVKGEQMWCKVEGEFIYSNESCGKRCRDYTPCNGKNGRCTELKQVFIGTGKLFTISKGGLVRRKKEN